MNKLKCENEKDFQSNDSMKRLRGFLKILNTRKLKYDSTNHFVYQINKLFTENAGTFSRAINKYVLKITNDDSNLFF